MKSFNPLVVVCALLAVAAAACCAVFGISWLNASDSGTASLASTRDTVLRSAEQAVINLNSLDYRHADTSLQNWMSSSTGQLHDQFAAGLKQEVADVQAAQNTTSARVLDAAVTSLDVPAGTASVMVAVDVSVTPAKGAPYSELQPEMGQLTLTATGWKLSALNFSDASASPSSPASSSPVSPSSSASPAPSPTRSH